MDLHALIAQGRSAEDDAEFAPLPFYSWDERPSHVDIEPDEAATAIHLSKGSLSRAAELLKVSLVRLSRLVRRSPYLQRVYGDHANAAVFRAADEYIHALFDPDQDNRRRETAASKVLMSKAAQIADSLFAPAKDGGALTVSGDDREITFTWRSPTPKMMDGEVVSSDDTPHEADEQTSEAVDRETT